jgi:hypothetical protein
MERGQGQGRARQGRAEQAGQGLLAGRAWQGGAKCWGFDVLPFYFLLPAVLLHCKIIMQQGLETVGRQKNEQPK